MFWILVRIASLRRLKISKEYVLWGNKNKIMPSFHIILLIKDSLIQQIHFNGNSFWNKCCRCNEGLLHTSTQCPEKKHGPHPKKVIINSGSSFKQIWQNLRSHILFQIFKPAHDKNYNETCATSEDWDQSAHPHSLIRVFPDRICLLQPPGYPRKDERGPLPHWMAIHADLRFCWCTRLIVGFVVYEPADDKTYNKTCATSEDSNQPANLRNLIRVDHRSFMVCLTFARMLYVR